MTWPEVLKQPEWETLSQPEKLQARAMWYDATILPEAQKAGYPEDEIAAHREREITTFDTGEGPIASFLGAATQGFLGTGTSAMQGVGALTGITALEEAGKSAQAAVESTFPTNPIYAKTNFVGNVLGNIGSFMVPGAIGAQVGAKIGLASATGLAASKALQAEQALGVLTSARAAELAAPLIKEAEKAAAQTGAAIASNTAMFASGAGSKAQEADAMGLTGEAKWLTAALGGLTEVASENIPGLKGMQDEFAALSKIPGLSVLSDGTTRGLKQVGAGVARNVAEELVAQVGGNVVSQAMAPEGYNAPDLLAGTPQAAAGGAIGGLMMGGLEAFRGKPATTDTLPVPPGKPAPIDAAIGQAVAAEDPSAAAVLLEAKFKGGAKSQEVQGPNTAVLQSAGDITFSGLFATPAPLPPGEVPVIIAPSPNAPQLWVVDGQPFASEAEASAYQATFTASGAAPVAEDVTVAEMAPVTPETAPAPITQAVPAAETAPITPEATPAPTTEAAPVAETAPVIEGVPVTPAEVPTPIDTTAPLEEQLTQVAENVFPSEEKTPEQQLKEDKLFESRMLDVNGGIKIDEAMRVLNLLKAIGATNAQIVVNDTGSPDPLASKGRMRGSRAPDANGVDTVWLNRNMLAKDTPVHEALGHGAIVDMQQSNPALFEAGRAVLSNSDLLKAVRGRYAREGYVYTNDSDLMEEVMATALGNNTGDLFAALAGNPKLLQQVKIWIAKAQVWFDEFLANKGVPPGMTIEQWARKVYTHTIAGKVKESGVARPALDLAPPAAPAPVAPAPVEPTPRQTRHRVFEGGSPMRVNPGEGVLDARNPDMAYRLTGQQQIDDILATGEVRAKEGKMRGGRSGETQWSKGHESLGYRAGSNKGMYVIETPSRGLNERLGGLPISAATRIWKSGENGKWEDVTSDIVQAAPAPAPVAPTPLVESPPAAAELPVPTTIPNEETQRQGQGQRQEDGLLQVAEPLPVPSAVGAPAAPTAPAPATKQKGPKDYLTSKRTGTLPEDYVVLNALEKAGKIQRPPQDLHFVRKRVAEAKATGRPISEKDQNTVDKYASYRLETGGNVATNRAGRALWDKIWAKPGEVGGTPDTVLEALYRDGVPGISDTDVDTLWDAIYSEIRRFDLKADEAGDALGAIQGDAVTKVAKGLQTKKGKVSVNAETLSPGDQLNVNGFSVKIEEVSPEFAYTNITYTVYGNSTSGPYKGRWEAKDSVEVDAGKSIYADVYTSAADLAVSEQAGKKATAEAVANVANVETNAKFERPAYQRSLRAEDELRRALEAHKATPANERKANFLDVGNALLAAIRAESVARDLIREPAVTESEKAAYVRDQNAKIKAATRGQEAELPPTPEPYSAEDALSRWEKRNAAMDEMKTSRQAASEAQEIAADAAKTKGRIARAESAVRYERPAYIAAADELSKAKTALDSFLVDTKRTAPGYYTQKGALEDAVKAAEATKDAAFAVPATKAEVDTYVAKQNAAHEAFKARYTAAPPVAETAPAAPASPTAEPAFVQSFIESFKPKPVKWDTAAQTAAKEKAAMAGARAVWSAEELAAAEDYVKNKNGEAIAGLSEKKRGAVRRYVMETTGTENVRYSLAGDNTPEDSDVNLRPSGVAKNRPNSYTRGLFEGMTYQGQSMQEAWDEAAEIYDRLGKEKFSFEMRMDALYQMRDRTYGNDNNMTPGAFVGWMILEQKAVLQDEEASEEAKEVARDRQQRIVDASADFAAESGQMVKGWHIGIAIAEGWDTMVETFENDAIHGGAIKAKAFKDVAKAHTRILGTLTTETLSSAPAADVTRIVEQRMVDVIRGDESALEGEAENEVTAQVLLDAVAAQDDITSTPWFQRGLAKLSKQLQDDVEAWLSELEYISMLEGIASGASPSLTAAERTAKNVARLKEANILTASDAKAAILTATVKAEALGKKIFAKPPSKPVKTPKNEAEALTLSEEDMNTIILDRFDNVLTFLMNQSKAPKAKSVRDKTINAIVSGLISKAGISVTRAKVTGDQRALAFGLLLQNQQTAAEVVNSVHKSLEEDGTTKGAWKRKNLKALFEVYVGKGFDTPSGADAKSPPYSEKQVTQLINSELKKLNLSLRKVVTDAALMRTTATNLEAQLRDTKRPFANELSPATLDSMVSAVLSQYSKTAKQMAEESEKRKLETSDRAKAREAIRKARTANATSIRKARAEGTAVPAITPLTPEEQKALLTQKPERVIDYLSRNFGFDLTSIVSLARAEDRKKSLDAMVADLADALGLTKAQAQLFMQPVIQEAMKTVDTKRLEKAKKQIDDATVKIGKTGIRVPKKQQKTDAQRLVDLAKLGGLNLNNVEDVLLNVIGAKKFTPEFKAYLEMLIQKANDPSLPPIARADYNQVFIQEIQSAKGISLLGLYAEFYMSNIFMSILSTLKVNAVWGFVKSSADTAAFLAGNMVFKGEFGTKVSAKTTMALTKIYLRAFFGGTQNQAKYILKTGKTPQDFENDNLVKFQQSQMELLAAMPETEIRLYREGKPLSPFWAKKAIAVSNFSKYTRRIMVATDAANRTPAMYMLRAANIARMIAMKGGSADITVEEIDSAMYGSDFKAALAAARAQAKREVASGVLGAAEEGIRTEEILNEGMGKSLGLSADESSLIFQQTLEYAKRWTVANKTEGVLGAISNNLVNTVRDVPGLSALMPAIRMPIGAFSQGIDWSPIGFVRYLAIKRNKGLSNSITNAIFNHDMSRAGWYAPHTLISEEQKNEMLIKASVGTALMLGLMLAIEAAIDDDEDKAAIYMTGRGPADIQKNKIWREKGNTPNMGRIYGVPFNFQESPAAPMFLTLGAWSDAKRYGKPGDGNSERLSYTFTRAMSGFLDAAVLKNLHDVLATFSGANSTSISSASNLTSRLVSVGLFPRLGGEINQILYGQMSKPDIEWAGKALSTVPFIPALFDKPALNWFGESIHGSRGNALGEVLPMLAHRISPILSDDPQMLFVARMGANALTTTRRLKDGTEVAEDYDLMRKWATDSGVAVRKFLTPERMAYFEAMRAKDVPTAEKAFDKEISAIRTRILSSYPQVIFR